MSIKDDNNTSKITSLFQQQNERIDNLSIEVHNVKNEVHEVKEAFTLSFSNMQREIGNFRSDIQDLNKALVGLLGKVTNAIIGVLVLGMVLVVLIAALAMFKGSGQDLNIKSNQLGELNLSAQPRDPKP